jgi:hypothetical protein
MTADPGFVGALIRSICTLSARDFNEVLRRLEDPSQARMSGGATWSIFKALDAMDREEQQELRALILEQRSEAAPTFATP